MPLPSRQGLVHAGAICMGMKLGRKGNAEGIRYYLLLPVAREQQQPPSLYNSGTWLLLERKVSKQLANCNSHCLLAIIRRTVINSNRWNSNGSVSLFFFTPIPKGHLLWAKLQVLTRDLWKKPVLWVNLLKGSLQTAFPCWGDAEQPPSCICALQQQTCPVLAGGGLVELVLSGLSQIGHLQGWRVQEIALWFHSFTLLWLYLFSSPGKEGSRAIQLKYVCILIHLFITLYYFT